MRQSKATVPPDPSSNWPVATVPPEACRSSFDTYAPTSSGSLTGAVTAWLVLPFRRAAWIVAFCRLNQLAYLSLGRAWRPLHLGLAPVSFMLGRWVNEDLDYRAEIGPGLLLLHPSAGVVVNGNSIIGRNFTLAGGNFVGGRGVLIGDDVTLGANAVVIAPCTVASGSVVGAGAVVVHDFRYTPGPLVGVQARLV